MAFRVSIFGRYHAMVSAVAHLLRQSKHPLEPECAKTVYLVGIEQDACLVEDGRLAAKVSVECSRMACTIRSARTGG